MQRAGPFPAVEFLPFSVLLREAGTAGRVVNAGKRWLSVNRCLQALLSGKDMGAFGVWILVYPVRSFAALNIDLEALFHHHFVYFFPLAVFYFQKVNSRTKWIHFQQVAGQQFCFQQHFAFD